MDTLEDTIYATLSYASRLGSKSVEWRVAYERIKEAVNILAETYRLHGKAGIPGSVWVLGKAQDLLESVKSEDLPRAAGIASEIVEDGRRRLASLYMLYRSITAITLGASLGGIILAILSLSGVTTQVGAMLNLSIIGILIAALLLPPRHATPAQVLAGILFLTAAFIEGQYWEQALYGLLLLSTPISVGAFRRV